MAKYAKSEYAKKLLDPRWQKKRLDILHRDDFTCQACGDKTTTLHVHHCFYEWKRDPWDYPDTSLVTLCEPCHEEETAIVAETKGLFWQTLAEQGIRAGEIHGFVCELNWAISGRGRNPRELLHILGDVLAHEEVFDATIAGMQARMRRVHPHLFKEAADDTPTTEATE
jgi:hypothetical protein